MFRSRNFRRARAIVAALAITLAANYAISFAAQRSGAQTRIPQPPTARSGAQTRIPQPPTSLSGN